MRACSPVHAASAFLLLLIVANVLVASAAAKSAPRSHPKLNSDYVSAPGVDSRAPASETEALEPKRKLLEVSGSCVRSLDGRQKGNVCRRRKTTNAKSPPKRLKAPKVHTPRQSTVPQWFKLIPNEKKRKALASAAIIRNVASLNATAEPGNNSSSFAGANVSAPDESKVEEKKPSMSLEKVRMDVLGRLEDEQQHQAQQQQHPPIHASANRSSSIPLLHRSTEESLTKGVNYASAELGAKIVASNMEGKHANALLLAEEERYWMSPCSANRSVVIELAESVLVKSITLMHNEYYSSISRAVLLQGAQIMPTDRWITLGLLAVDNMRGAQTYSIPSPVELRYLSLQMHGSYGKETFCTMSGVQVFGKAAMGIIEQEIDREAHLAMRSYADVQAEILKSLDPNPVPVAAAVVVAPVDPVGFEEANELELAGGPPSSSDRFKWGECIVCIDVCRVSPSTVAAALAAEVSRQQAQLVASVNVTHSAQNFSAEGVHKPKFEEDSATSLPMKSIPASASLAATSLSVAAPGGESQHIQPAPTSGAGESVITKDVVASAAVGTAVLHADVDVPKIQLDSNIIRKLWNKLRDLEFNHSVVSGFVSVLSMKHEEQLSHLSSSTANLELALLSIRNSSSCECPDTSALERNLGAATARIAELEAAIPRIAELEAAVLRLTALETKVSLLMAASLLPSDPR